MRKNDERNPHHMRGSDDKGSQNWGQDKTSFFVKRLVSFIQTLHVGSAYARIRVARSIYLDIGDAGSINLTTDEGAELRGELKMTLLPGILPYSDDFPEVNQAFGCLDSLERCYSFKCGDAATSEFLAELAQLEGQTLSAVRSKAVVGLRKITKGVLLLNKLKTRIPYLCGKLRDQRSEAKKNEDLNRFNTLSKRLQKVCYLAGQKVIKSYVLLVEAVDESWDYFPVEIHEIFYEWSDKIFKKLDLQSLENSDCDHVPELFADGADLIQEINDILRAFAFSVRAASEKNELKPKLRLTELSHFRKELNPEPLKKSLPSEDEYGYTQEDGVWLDSDLSDLEGYGSYNFEPGERESFKPIHYVPGRGFVIFDE